MKCLRCDTENSESTDYCSSCNSPLRFRRRTDQYKKRKIIMVTSILLVWIAGFAFFFKDNLLSDPDSNQTSLNSREERTKAREDARQKMMVKLRAASDDERANRPPEDQAASTPKQQATPEPVVMNRNNTNSEIASGWLTILDPWDSQVTKMRATLVAPGWVALPVRACLAGNRWIFQDDKGNITELKSGLWRDGDPVGIWHSGKTSENTGLISLTAWDSGKPLSWYSIESGAEQDGILVGSPMDQGYVSYTALPESINEVGILVQDSGLVGWTFGQWLPGAYLWTSPLPAGLQQDLSVENFYRVTFAGGREESFAVALAMLENDRQLIGALDIFVEGFRKSPKLAPEDTPYYLLPEEVVKQMRGLARQAISEGYEQAVLEKLDSKILQQINDINLFMDVATSMVNVYGFDRAIREIETTGAIIVQNQGVDVPALNQLHMQLYQEWLQNMISNGNQNLSSQIHEAAVGYYPEDPYIHLLGVELELLKGNWQEAERLIMQRNYPPAYMDRYELLIRQISELKGQEGRIVVNFPPGSNRIPLSASINGVLIQDFLVDTGASMVVIPSSTMQDLGLEVISGDHYDQHQVSTAGGMVMASEVVIESIEIGGWVEYDVRALVMDIPEQPGLGLLGLNYLGRFQMDLRNDEGTLMLTPK